MGEERAVQEWRVQIHVKARSCSTSSQSWDFCEEIGDRRRLPGSSQASVGVGSEKSIKDPKAQSNV